MRSTRIRPHALRFAAVLLAFWTAACRSTGPLATVAAPAAACIVSDDAPRSGVSLALTEPVAPAHAPIPDNGAERIVFRQLYETLVTVDCEGRVVPGLAQSWSLDETGHVWQFQLRPDATFWDGRPVTAADVVASWQVNAPRAVHLFNRLSLSTAVDARRVRVELREPGADAALFAQPAFTIARADTAVLWRVGSGPFRPAAHDDARVLRLRARDARSATLDIRMFTDARRALDAGIDMLITADPYVLAYAQAVPGYTSTTLTWSRTYALAAQADGPLPPQTVLAGLARDAVRATARAADAADACLPRPAAPPVAAATTRSLVYAHDDATARAIAERLVALAWPAPRAPDWLRTLLPAGYDRAGVPAALGVERTALADSVRSRRALAYVIALPRTAGSCSDALLAGDATARALLSAGLHVTPLIDTRDYMVHRTGLGRILIDGDGVIRFPGGAP